MTARIEPSRTSAQAARAAVWAGGARGWAAPRGSGHLDWCRGWTPAVRQRSLPSCSKSPRTCLRVAPTSTEARAVAPRRAAPPADARPSCGADARSRAPRRPPRPQASLERESAQFGPAVGELARARPSIRHSKRLLGFACKCGASGEALLAPRECARPAVAIGQGAFWSGRRPGPAVRGWQLMCARAAGDPHRRARRTRARAPRLVRAVGDVLIASNSGRAARLPSTRAWFWGKGEVRETRADLLREQAAAQAHVTG